MTPNHNGEASYKTSLSYLIMFESGKLPKKLFNTSSLPDSLKEMGVGAYHVSSGELNQFGDQEPFFASYFRKAYTQRIRKRFLRARSNILFEFKPVNISSLILKDGSQMTPETPPFRLQFVVELSELGVLVFHVFLSPNIVSEPIDCINLKDPSLIISQIDIQYSIKIPVRLHGNYSIIDIARFFAICTICCLYEKKRWPRKILSYFNSSKPISEIWNNLIRRLSENFEPFEEAEVYPTFYFEVNLHKASLKDFCLRSNKVLRALITDDLNWDKKSDSIVSALIPNVDFGSRETLSWYVHHMGSVKLFSNDFETPILNSKILTHFELGIVLSMKYYLHRTMSRLQAVIEGSWTPREIAEFRRSELDKLQSYYNLDIACKDTTADRFQRFMKILHVDDAFSVVQNRFNYLGEAISTRYQQQISRVQILLTVVFGAFGAAKIGYSIFTRLSDSTQDAKVLTWEIIYTMGGTFLVILILLLLINILRRL